MGAPFWNELSRGSDGHFHDPALAESVSADLWFVGAKGPADYMPLKDVQYAVLIRLFNRFNWDPVPTKDVREIRPVPTGRTRKMQKDGLCWQEREIERKAFVRRCYLLTQYHEIYAVNTTLEAYYSFVTGKKLGVPVAVLGTASSVVAAAPPGSGALGALVRFAAGAPAVAALSNPLVVSGTVGLGVFIGATYIADAVMPAAELLSEGWTTAGFVPSHPEFSHAAARRELDDEIEDPPSPPSTEFEYLRRKEHEHEWLFWERVGDAIKCPDVIDLSGRWRRTDAGGAGLTVRVFHAEARIMASFDAPTAAAAAEYGLYPGSRSFDGVLNGRSLTGSMSVYLPRDTAKRCPKRPRRTSVPLHLVLSDDGRTLHGYRINHQITEACTSGEELREDIALVRD